MIVLSSSAEISLAESNSLEKQLCRIPQQIYAGYKLAAARLSLPDSGRRRSPIFFVLARHDRKVVTDAIQ
jgi:hypothetical protein